MKLCIVFASVVALCGCSTSVRPSATANDVWEARLSEMQAENAKLHNDIEALKADTCVHKMLMATEEAAHNIYETSKPVVVQGAKDGFAWVKKEYTEHTQK
jgi:outer membrane murein-binding lipoprotein Lpp